MRIHDILPDDMIRVDTWQTLAACYGLHQQDLFDADLLMRQKSGPEVVVSGCSDAGICRQAEHFPAKDIKKYVPVIDWDAIEQECDTYPYFRIGAAVRDGRCFPADFYSIKTDRFTWGTFPHMPDWLHGWFSVNVNVEDDRIKLLPFGLNNEMNGGTPGWELVYDAWTEPAQKSELLYCNLQWNSFRRFAVKGWAASCGFATYRHQPDVPFRDYLAELARHKFVLCPEGNGLDQYRIYEALYTGSIPVVEDSKWARRLQAFRFPLLVVNDMTLLTAAFLEDLWLQSRSYPWDYRALSVKEWGRVFRQVKLVHGSI